MRRVLDPVGTDAAIQIGPEFIVAQKEVDLVRIAKIANEALVQGGQVLDIREFYPFSY